MATIISKSKIEYLTHSINWRRGCPNNCAYCYMALAAQRFEGLKPAGGWENSELRIDATPQQLSQQVEQELKSLGKNLEYAIMMTSSHDPATPDQAADELMAILDAFDRVRSKPARYLLLTKRPDYLLSRLGRCPRNREEWLWFGTTITTLGVTQWETYEPKTEPPALRLDALRRAHDAGYQTWISAEPPLPEVYLGSMIPAIMEDLPDGMRPWIVMGKLNHGVGPVMSEWARSQHWSSDRIAAANYLLEEQDYAYSIAPNTGCFYVKKELENYGRQH